MRRGSRWLAWLERMMIIAGMAMLVWCALFVLDAIRGQREARQSLDIAVSNVRPLAPHAPAEPDARPLPLSAPPPGSAIANISIPRVQLSAVVLHGSDGRTLRRGPGHLEHTAMPGEPGNVVIAGHRDSFFSPLRNVHVGDDIFLDTPYGHFQYRVTSIRVVNPHDLSVLEPTDTATLTLITCYPFWVWGNAPDRFIVRAAAVQDLSPAAPVVAMSLPQSDVAATVGGAAVTDGRIANVPAPADDDTLVRQAIEQFRLTYNARLVTHSDVRADGPLVFRACDIIILADQATATCETVQSEDSQPDVWTLILQRVDSAWAIKTIQSGSSPS